MRKIYHMRRYFAFVLLLAAALLSGCQRRESPPTEPTVTTTASESTEPIQTEEPTAAPTEPNTAWLVEDWESLSYEEYFSERRAIPKAHSEWSVDGVRYGLEQDEEGIYVECWDTYESNPPAIYRIPNTAEFGQEGAEKLVSCFGNGRYGFLALETGELLQVDLVSGERETLFTGKRILSVWMLERDVIYFAAEMEESCCIYRLYLPSKTLDVLYDQIPADTPGEWFRILPNDAIGEENTTACVAWEMMNPEFFPLLQAELRDLDSPYRQTEWGQGMADRIWTPENIESPDRSQSILWLCWAVQDESGVRPFLRGEVDCFTGECTIRLGCIDNCWFGTGQDHDHYGPMENPPFWFVPQSHG